MQPDVSFVMAAFNASATIKRALTSALASRGVTIEVIVADDLSRDNTVALVEGFGDQRIHLLQLAKNGGPGTARNAALKAATGRYIAVLDADDEVHPHRMARLVARLDESGAAAAVDNIEFVGGTHGKVPMPMFSREMFERMATLTLADYIHGNRLFSGRYNFGYFKPVLRASFLKQDAIAYPETIRIGEDYLLLASVLAHGGACITSGDIGYRYHVTEGSVSRKLSLDHVKQMITADAEFLHHHCFTSGSSEDIAQRARTRSLHQAESFLSMIEGIKTRSIGSVFSHAVRDPFAIRHFTMPATARIQRLLGRTAS